MKTAIIYYSKHHGNTKKLLDAVKACGEVTLIEASAGKSVDLEGYGLIGFASGIYFGKYHKSVIEFAKNNLPENKNVFFMHTGGLPGEKNNSSVKAITDSKGCKCLGTYFCRGYNTYGPFKLVGGIAKGHPNKADIDGAVSFFKKIQN
ncbi:MAG: flavodoxin family protein [Clostridiales bacterium]|nr:flavodoxin family protein [Clostridiales bacterium]